MAWLVRGLAALLIVQTFGCERGVRYRCLVRATAGGDWSPIDVTRAGRGEAHQAAATLDVDLETFAVRCAEVDQGARGTPTKSEGSDGGVR